MRANKNKILTLFFAVILSWGCQEIIDLDLEKSDTRVVIEGRIVDENSIKKIKISFKR